MRRAYKGRRPAWTSRRQSFADFARYRVEPDERFSLSDDAPADTDGLYDEPRYVIARLPSPPADVKRFAEQEPAR